MGKSLFGCTRSGKHPEPDPVSEHGSDPHASGQPSVNRLQITSSKKWLAMPITDAATTAIAVYRSTIDHRAQSFTKLSILTPLMLPTLCRAMITPKKLRCLFIGYLKL
jgi:hypothetical protein